MVAPSRTAAGPERIPYLSQPCVRLVPELSLAALKQKCDKELAMWHCLKVVNHWGSGRLPLRMAIEYLSEMFNYSESTVYRTLAKGDGIFWKWIGQNPGAVLEIRGLKHVAEYLGTPWLSQFYLVPAEQFNTVRTRRSWMYATFFDYEGRRYTKPISRQSITEATGLNRRRQQRYEAVVGVEKQQNFAFQRKGDEFIPITIEVEGKSKLFTIHRQLGNTYHCPVVSTTRGMCRKLRTKARSFQEGEALVARRFFHSAQKLVKTHDRADEAFLAIRDKRSRFPKRIRGEWCSV